MYTVQITFSDKLKYILQYRNVRKSRLYIHMSLCTLDYCTCQIVGFP